MTSPLPHRVVFAKKNEKQKNKNILKNRLVKTINWKKNDSQKKQKHTQKPNRSGGARNRTIQKKTKTDSKKNQKRIKKKAKKNHKRIKTAAKCNKLGAKKRNTRKNTRKINNFASFCLFCCILLFFFAFCCSFDSFLTVFIFFRFFFDFSLSRFLIFFWVGFWFFFESSCFWFSLAYSFLSPVLSPFLFFYFFPRYPTLSGVMIS